MRWSYIGSDNLALHSELLTCRTPCTYNHVYPLCRMVGSSHSGVCDEGGGNRCNRFLLVYQLDELVVFAHNLLLVFCCIRGLASPPPRVIPNSCSALGPFPNAEFTGTRTFEVVSVLFECVQVPGLATLRVLRLARLLRILRVSIADFPW